MRFLSAYGNMFYVLFFFTFVSATFFGVPAFLLYRRLRWGKYLYYICGGAVLSFLTLFVWKMVGMIGWPTNPILFVVAGVAGAVTFRAVVGDGFAVGPTSKVSEI